MVKTKIKRDDLFKAFIFLSIITAIIFLLNPEIASATVESSIKGVGSNFQKIALGCGVIGFAIGGVGMMFGSQWGMRTIIGTILGTACVLGGNSMISFLTSSIK